MTKAEAIEKTSDLIEAAITALDKANMTETNCVATVLRETRKYTEFLTEYEINGGE